MPERYPATSRPNDIKIGAPKSWLHATDLKCRDGVFTPNEPDSFFICTVLHLIHHQ